MSKVIALYSPPEQGGTWGASHAILPTHSPLFGNILKLSEEPLVFYPFLQQTGACFLPACVDRFLRPHWFLDLLFKHQVILQMKYGSWFSECCLQISSIRIIWKLLSSANRGVAAQSYWKSARSVCEHPLPRLVLPLRQHCLRVGSSLSEGRAYLTSPEALANSCFPKTLEIFLVFRPPQLLRSLLIVIFLVGKSFFSLAILNFLCNFGTVRFALNLSVDFFILILLWTHCNSSLWGPCLLSILEDSQQLFLTYCIFAILPAYLYH